MTASAFVVLIWISDLMDGYVARSRNEVSELGKIIDPLADKISIIALGVALLTKGLVALWFIVIIVLRDIIILAGGSYLKAVHGAVLQSNFLGKISVFVIGLTLFYVLLSAGFNKYAETRELISNVLIFSSLVMAVLSLIIYTKRFVKFIK